MSIFRHLGRMKQEEHSHSKRGRKFTFHGAFKDKAAAVNKERSTPGSFIIDKNGRHIVVTENK